MITPDTFRQGIIEVLKLASSAKSQREYQARVPIAGVVAEVFCQWEDLYHPDVPTFEVAFSEPEREALASYEVRCKLISKDVEDVGLDEFQALPVWNALAEIAQKTLAVLEGDM